MIQHLVQGPLLIPRAAGQVDYFAEGAVAWDQAGVVVFSGDARQLPPTTVPARRSDGVMLPPLLDLHTHVPQHPIRGRFAEGICDDAPGGKLLASLQKNVFPTEARCHAVDHAREVIDRFRIDTLSHGVVGGSAYMTVSATATRAALEGLGNHWQVGMVLMNQNCPEYLRADEDHLDRDITAMVEAFGTRCVITDRFAVAVDSTLRRRASALAHQLGLRTQTHLNEQTAEKDFVETQIYPQADSYTDVYRRDGLLNHRCILAHCIHMRQSEWKMVADTGSVVAHCPSSNLLLGSGRMELDELFKHGIDYAIATDVGASPTCSMLAEMRRFLLVHGGCSARATPSEALHRSTLAPARILGLGKTLGGLEIGQPASLIEARPVSALAHRAATADEAITALLPIDPDHPVETIRRVTLNGQVIFEKETGDA